MRSGQKATQAICAPIRVRVELGVRGYDVVVGAGVRKEVAGLVPATARRATVVTQTGIGVEVDPGLPYEVLTIRDGERAKSLATVEDCSAGPWRGRGCTVGTLSWPSAAAS